MNIQNFLLIPTSSLVFIGAFIIVFALIIRQEIRFKRLLKGKNAKTLEDTILGLRKEVTDLQKFEKEAKVILAENERKLKQSIQSVESVKFNPWKGTGSAGNQSFASAFINEKGDGIVISSLYSRDRVSVFSKQIKNMQPEQELSPEEKEALDKAYAKIKK